MVTTPIRSVGPTTTFGSRWNRRSMADRVTKAANRKRKIGSSAVRPNRTAAAAKTAAVAPASATRSATVTGRGSGTRATTSARPSAATSPTAAHATASTAANVGVAGP